MRIAAGTIALALLVTGCAGSAPSARTTLPGPTPTSSLLPRHLTGRILAAGVELERLAEDFRLLREEIPHAALGPAERRQLEEHAAATERALARAVTQFQELEERGAWTDLQAFRGRLQGLAARLRALRAALEVAGR